MTACCASPCWRSLGLPLERFWTFPFVPAGISVIEFHGGMTIIRAHDLDEHLAPLQRGTQIRTGRMRARAPSARTARAVAL